MRPAEIDHRLDGEEHAGPQFDALAGAAIMEDVGNVVEQLTEAMAAEIAHHRAALGFGIDLDGMADVAGAGAGDRGLDAAQQALICDLHQPGRLARYLADRDTSGSNRHASHRRSA